MTTSSFGDPSKWRLRAGIIPYKTLSMEGEFTNESADISLSVAIESKNLVAFAEFLLPPPIRIGNLEFPTFRSLAGIPQITVSSLRFRSFDSDYGPIDPFSGDLGAPSSTYFPVIQVDINYKSGKNQTKDPETFLEITGNATGDFLHTAAPKSKWQPEKSAVGSDDEPDDDGNIPTRIDTETNEPIYESSPQGGTPVYRENDGATEQNRDPIAPINITVPMTEWTLRWPQIRFEFFRDVLIHRLRILMGRVNSEVFPILFGAIPETLLFEGFTYKQRNTWRDGEINTPPVEIEIKILEKRILWNGIYRGHNDFWRPEKARWERLLIDGSGTAYRKWDYNILFKP